MIHRYFHIFFSPKNVVSQGIEIIHVLIVLHNFIFLLNKNPSISKSQNPKAKLN
jgi:hypothetical protein